MSNEKQEKDKVPAAPVAAIPVADLKDVLMAAIQEGRKPAPPTETEQLKLDADKAARQRETEQQLLKLKLRREKQKGHSHKRRDGSYRTVYVVGSNYFLCQECCAIIRNGAAPPDYTGGDIYDPELFKVLWDSRNVADVS